MPPNVFRSIPSVSQLLESPALKSLVDQVSHHAVVSRARAILDDLRCELAAAADQRRVPDVAELAERVAMRIRQDEQPALRPVVNATGVLLHTGLGRAPLADEAVAEMTAVARDYASVELDLASGKRSQRVLAVEARLRELSGAEAAMVVNNNAGATVLALGALAAGRQVVVSRGQLIEIGGSYRLPEVMAASGALLHEVGTTNRTHLNDYAAAVGEHTAALLLVHTSNYRVVGFTAEVTLDELVQLGRSRALPVIHDIGSGALLDFAEFGLPGEPVAADSIRRGADLVLFSGDKLLGGPQCGILVGRRQLIDKVIAHPLARALRVDKLTLAALAATLRLYRDPATARRSIPLLQLLATSAENLKGRAERLADRLAPLSPAVKAETLSDTTFIGGGSLPGHEVPTWCVALSPFAISTHQLADRLRRQTPAIVARVAQDRVLLDLRSVFPRQDQLLLSAVEAVFASPSRGGPSNTPPAATQRGQPPASDTLPLAGDSGQ